MGDGVYTLIHNVNSQMFTEGGLSFPALWVFGSVVVGTTRNRAVKWAGPHVFDLCCCGANVIAIYGFAFGFERSCCSCSCSGRAWVGHSLRLENWVSNPGS